MYRNMISQILISLLLVVAVFTTGCVTTTVGPDGQVQISEPDYMAIQMMATASIAVWAASQKNGITSQDAEMLSSVVDSVVAYHEDGSPIDSGLWGPAIAKQVPVRWQGVAVVFVQLTEYELKKYGVMDQIPSPDSVGGKIMRALATGAKLGLQPYLAPRA